VYFACFSTGRALVRDLGYTPIGFCTPLGFCALLGFCTLLGFYTLRLFARDAEHSRSCAAVIAVPVLDVPLFNILIFLSQIFLF
jgi:hypothetical protein